MKDSSIGTLNRIDKRILRLLQQDGRLTNADLAIKVNVSAATCHRRTQRLFNEGYIQSVGRRQHRVS
ncbi:winged helix-turn-helix transcriptional regulator [Yoonia sp. BS5-3]|uniref:Lrp/AsnC family transcriptional regulator n=1 Tax=Yoonia phaeophyticola TaxID=3137369 RepID=A0ABZ2V4N4_9RHOB